VTAAINIAILAFPNCFTVPASSDDREPVNSPRSAHAKKNTRGQTFTLRAPQGQQTFTKTVGRCYRLATAVGHAAETHCIPPATQEHHWFDAT